MLPVRNFISLATTRRGSTCRSDDLEVARDMALLTMWPATDTAAEKADDLGDEEWYAALLCRIRTSRPAVRVHSKHVVVGLSSAEAAARLSRTCIFSLFPPRGDPIGSCKALCCRTRHLETVSGQRAVLKTLDVVVGAVGCRLFTIPKTSLRLAGLRSRNFDLSECLHSCRC